MPIPCPFTDPYSGSGGSDPNQQLADLLDHIADKHCPVQQAATLIRAAAGKMRNPTGTPRQDPDLERIDDLSQYAVKETRGLTEK